MVIKIHSFDKLMGFEFFGRRIKGVQTTDYFNQPVYIFEFDAIKRTRPKPQNTYHCWEDSFKIYLHRHPKNGVYELFVMGLHGVTCQELSYEDVSNFRKFVNCFTECISLCKKYWDESDDTLLPF